MDLSDQLLKARRMLQKLIKPDVDPLQDKARSLVSAAELFAINACSPLSDEFPFVQDLEEDEWDFCVTAAAVAIAVLSLDEQPLDSDRKANLRQTIDASLDEWHADGRAALADCLANTPNLKASLADTSSRAAADEIAQWLLRQMKDSAPLPSEKRSLSLAIGSKLVDPFRNWWTI